MGWDSIFPPNFRTMIQLILIYKISLYSQYLLLRSTKKCLGLHPPITQPPN